MKCRCCGKRRKYVVKVHTTKSRLVSVVSEWLCMECMFRYTDLSRVYHVGMMPDEFFEEPEEE